MSTNDKPKAQRIKTPDVRISYPYLDEPRQPQESDQKQAKYNAQKAKYSVQIVADSKEDLTELRSVCLALLVTRYGDKAKVQGLIKNGALHWPFRTPETELHSAHAPGTMFFNCSSLDKPGCVWSHPKPGGRGEPETIPDNRIKEVLYPGCYVRVTLTPFLFKNSGNEGVGIALNNVQFRRDAERFDSRKKAEDEFEADQEAADMDFVAGAAPVPAPADDDGLDGI